MGFVDLLFWLVVFSFFLGICEAMCKAAVKIVSLLTSGKKETNYYISPPLPQSQPYQQQLNPQQLNPQQPLQLPESRTINYSFQPTPDVLRLIEQLNQIQLNQQRMQQKKTLLLKD